MLKLHFLRAREPRLARRSRARRHESMNGVIVVG